MFKFLGNRESSSYREMKNLVDDGLKALENGDNERAISLLRTAIKYYEKNVEKAEKMGNEFSQLLVKIAVNLSKLNENSRALDALEIAIRLNPKNEKAWLQKGIINFLQEYTSNFALICFNEVVKINPSNIEGWQHRGDAYRILENKKEAIYSYEKVVELKTDVEVSDFDRILKIDGENEQALRGKAMLLEKKGRVQEARELYTMLYRRFPRKMEYRMGIVRTGGTVEGHSAVHEEHKEAKPPEPEEYATHGMVNISEQVKKEESWEKPSEGSADELFKSDEAFISGVTTLTLDRKYDQAIQLYRKYLEKGESLPVAIKYIELLERLNRDQEAVDWFGASKINFDEIEDPVFWLIKGRIEFKLKRYTEAVNSLNRCLKLNPDMAESWYLKGIIEMNNSSYSKAISFLKMAAKLHPEYKKEYLEDERFRVLKDYDEFKKIFAGLN